MKKQIFVSSKKVGRPKEREEKKKKTIIFIRESIIITLYNLKFIKRKKDAFLVDAAWSSPGS